MSSLQGTRKNKEIEKRKEMAIRRPFDDLFDNFRQNMENTFFTPSFGPSRYHRMSSFLDSNEMRTPLCDIIDKGDKYLISFEVPGIQKDKMEIKATNEYVTVSANVEEQTKDSEEENYVLNERAYRAFNRKILFQDDVVPSKIEASLENGILRIELPKQKPTSVEETQIKIK
jgi:HSP20 family protein